MGSWEGRDVGRNVRRRWEEERGKKGGMCG